MVNLRTLLQIIFKFSYYLMGSGSVWAPDFILKFKISKINSILLDFDDGSIVIKAG